MQILLQYQITNVLEFLGLRGTEHCSVRCFIQCKQYVWLDLDF